MDIVLFFCWLIGFRELSSYDEKTDQMNNKSNHPRDGVGQKQHKHRVVFGQKEDGEDPENSQTAGTQHGNDGRGYGIAHATDAAYDAIHQTAGEIQAADQQHSS